MVRRTTWIFLAVLLVLVTGYFVFNRYKAQTASQSTPTPSSQAVFSFSLPEMQSIRLEDNQGRVVELEKVNGAWSLVQPAAESTDADRASELATNLIQMRTISLLAQAPDWTAAGLDKPVYRVKVILADGSEQDLVTGTMTPTGSGYYAQLPGGKVAVVDQFSVESLAGYLDSPPIYLTPTVGLTPLSPELLGTPQPN